MVNQDTSEAGQCLHVFSVQLDSGSLADLSQLAEKIPVYAYQTQTPVIAGDNRLTFPIGDILEDVSRGMLAGESLSVLMEEMDQKAAVRQE